MTPAELMSQKVAEIEVTYKNKVKPSERIKISNSKDAYELLAGICGDKIEYCEQFFVVLLTRANTVLGVSKISEGGVCSTVVDPKKVMQIALRFHSCSLLLAHNHPSGNTRPSEQDIQLTRKLKAGADLFDISIIDHLIISSEGFFSFADEGLL